MSSSSVVVERAQHFSFVIIAGTIGILLFIVVLMCGLVHSVNSYDSLVKIGNKVIKRDLIKIVEEIKSKDPKLVKLTPSNNLKLSVLVDLCKDIKNNNSSL